MTPFRIAIRDEIFHNGALVESRASHGEARQEGNQIVASDRGGQDLLPAPVKIVFPDARVRVVTRATGEDVSTTISITMDGVSIVTTPEYAQRDYELLRSLGARPSGPQSPSLRLGDDSGDRAGGPVTAGRRPALPLVWRNGSGAVLLHEAAGHPAEHGEPPLEWPSWLRVVDEGLERANLLAGEAPRALRRESFRDVPLHRMTNLVVSQENAPFSMPDDLIEIHLLGGGGYDPLTSLVTLHVAVADLVERGVRSRLAPFEIVASRERVARSLLGASGEPERYPGVICSREGQELYVGSRAPLLITTELT